jgi:hypothetical protein
MVGSDIIMVDLLQDSNPNPVRDGSVPSYANHRPSYVDVIRLMMFGNNARSPDGNV